MFAMRHQDRILCWQGYAGAPGQFYDVAAVMERVAEVEGLHALCAKSISPIVRLQITMNGETLS